MNKADMRDHVMIELMRRQPTEVLIDYLNKTKHLTRHFDNFSIDQLKIENENKSLDKKRTKQKTNGKN